MLHRASELAGPFEHGNEPSGFVQAGDFLTTWVTVSFSKRILLCGVSYLPTYLPTYLPIYLANNNNDTSSV
jgi:hypothetical protein